MHHVYGVTGKVFYDLDTYHKFAKKEDIRCIFITKLPFIIQIRSALGGFPWPPNQGLCPWTPLGAKPTDPHYRLALRARHMAPLSENGRCMVHKFHNLSTGTSCHTKFSLSISFLIRDFQMYVRITQKQPRAVPHRWSHKVLSFVFSYLKGHFLNFFRAYTISCCVTWPKSIHLLSNFEHFLKFLVKYEKTDGDIKLS